MSGRDGVEGESHPRRTKRAPFRAPDPEQKVGPGSPPVEHQWPKGHCPNPLGRPRKKVVEMDIPTGPTPFQKQILEFSRKVVSEIDGEPVTNTDILLKTMKAYMKDKPEFAKILLQQIGEANRAEHEFKMLVLSEALAHQEERGPSLQRPKCSANHGHLYIRTQMILSSCPTTPYVFWGR